jgi:arylsulfatase A-like enzyme
MMNFLLIVCDTLRPDYLGCYGNDWIRTPNIDALAHQAYVFDNCHAASFPTGPMRKDLLSGRYTFTYTSWRDEWKPDHPVMAEVFRDAGFATSMVSDTPANRSYSRGFESFEMIEGQSGFPADGEEREELHLPADPRKLRVPLKRLRRIARSRSAWRGEEDRFAAQTMRAAARWLEGRHGSQKPFLLVADTFDPHEPWDPPRYYIDQYDPGYLGDELYEPSYEPSSYASDEEIRHMRFMYAGEVSLVDRWVGYLLETLDVAGLADETCVLLTSDHGFYHGEHGFIGKVRLDREGRIIGRWPLYGTISRIPLIIRVPGREGGRLDGLCQPPDFLPTILNLAGLPSPKHIQGHSLVPRLEGGSEDGPRAAASSLTYRQDESVRPPTSFRTGEYLYIYGGDEWRSEYYDIRSDPAEERNLLDELEAEARAAHREMLEFLENIGCPKTSIGIRREFNPAPRESLPLERIL